MVKKLQNIIRIVRQPFLSIISRFKVIPQQVRSLVILFILGITGFVILRGLLIPESFGKYGHYRADAVDSIISREVRYAGQTACYECHDDIEDTKRDSYHRNVSCESCHGPSADHVKDPETHIPSAPRQRGYCALCHSYNPSRPTGFPQVEIPTHNPIEPCMSCHYPHDPTPPHTPEECRACHRQISRTKGVSHHWRLKCIDCHETPEAHKVNPRAAVPTKPLTREFCGRCHAEDADSAKEVPRIDIKTHNERYVCWQCHYPHHPEAGK